MLKESRAQGPDLLASGAEMDGGINLVVIGSEEGGGRGALEEEVGLGDGAGLAGDGRVRGVVGKEMF